MPWSPSSIQKQQPNCPRISLQGPHHFCLGLQESNPPWIHSTRKAFRCIIHGWVLNCFLPIPSPCINHPLSRPKLRIEILQAWQQWQRDTLSLKSTCWEICTRRKWRRSKGKKDQPKSSMQMIGLWSRRKNPADVSSGCIRKFIPAILGQWLLLRKEPWRLGIVKVDSCMHAAWVLVLSKLELSSSTLWSRSRVADHHVLITIELSFIISKLVVVHVLRKKLHPLLLLCFYKQYMMWNVLYGYHYS